MVSHSRYESPLFGSGWLNADGRVVVVSQDDAEESVESFSPGVEVVKVTLCTIIHLLSGGYCTVQ